MATCCWEWTGTKNCDGYGRFRYTANNVRKLERAHAVSLSFGLGYVPGYVMHRCDNPSCVRPSHLKEGTHEENTREAYAKGRQPRRIGYRGEKVKQAKLTECDVRAIRAQHMNGDSHVAIAPDYGVSPSAISQIIRGKTWAHVK